MWFFPCSLHLASQLGNSQLSCTTKVIAQRLKQTAKTCWECLFLSASLKCLRLGPYRIFCCGHSFLSCLIQFKWGAFQNSRPLPFPSCLLWMIPCGKHLWTIFFLKLNFSSHFTNIVHEEDMYFITVSSACSAVCLPSHGIFHKKDIIKVLFQ